MLDSDRLAECKIEWVGLRNLGEASFSLPSLKTPLSLALWKLGDCLLKCGGGGGRASLLPSPFSPLSL